MSSEPNTEDTVLDQLLTRATDALGTAITNRLETEQQREGGDHQ